MIKRTSDKRLSESLLLDLYELTMAESYSLYRSEVSATFDLFIRNMPRNRSYLVFCGLQSALEYIKGLRFSKEDIDYLHKLKMFSPGFLSLLENFKFSGDVWAMREGEVFFPGEPVLRVTAPLIEAQIVESFLLSTVNLESMIASKASRIINAACDCQVHDFSLRRTHGPQAALKVARSAYIAGFSATSNVLASKLYAIPPSGTMAHSFVMSFRDELDSFLAYSTVFPDRTILLVDTYNVKKGIDNAVKIGNYLKERGHLLYGIRIDSGDIVRLSRMARKILDKAGLRFVKIFASGNLDEFKISKLLKKKSCIDSFGVGTNMGASMDAPSLDAIYKLSEITDDSGDFIPVMKLSSTKVTWPGRKQVYRVSDKKGIFVKDIIGLQNDNIKGEPLLKKVLSRGNVICKMPNLQDIRLFSRNRIKAFPGQIRSVRPGFIYPVSFSPKLASLKNSLISRLK